MASDYSHLNTATLGTEYLFTNATTHSFIFGAMAELVDNARDAKADSLEIYTVAREDAQDDPLLCFKDDGCGMSPEEANNVIIFGSSSKADQEEPIGMYGNGLKSGSMRLGKDMIMFTKKQGVFTCLMISRTFFESENIKQIVVPVPSFDAGTRKIYGTDRKKHMTELTLLYKYSPFKNEQSIMEQFDKIAGPNGTMVICYNLTHAPSGDLELDFTTDPFDIRTSLQNVDDGPDVSDVVERRSFRAYASILYKSPRMKITLQGKRVRTRLLAYTLCYPKKIIVNYTSFKKQAERQLAEAKKEIEVAKRKLCEIQGEVGKLAKSTNAASKKDLVQLRKLQLKEEQLDNHLKEKKLLVERKKKQSKSEQLEFFFGLNLNERYHDGMFFYNSDRLIKMYVKEGTLQAKEEITYRGIIAVVSVPKSSLVPTHNKQDFNDQTEYKKLRKCVDQAMQQYLEQVLINEWQTKRGLTIADNWGLFGYDANNWRKPPSEEEQYKTRRARNVTHLEQCDKCLKWRLIPFHKDLLYKEFPDNWQCSNSHDPATNKCFKPEILPKIETLQFKAQVKPSTEPEQPTQEDAKEKGKKTARSINFNSDQAVKDTQELTVISASPAKRRRRILTPPPLSPPNKNSISVSASQQQKLASASPPPVKISRRPSTTVEQQLATPASSNGKDSQQEAHNRVSAPPPVTAKLLKAAPPLRIMRRPSPSRLVPDRSHATNDNSVRSSKEESPRRSPVKPKPSPFPTQAFTDHQESRTQLASPEDLIKTSVVRIPQQRKSAEEDVIEEGPVMYRMLTEDDLLERNWVGMQVQGRYQKQWRNATVMECRGSEVLLRFESKISLVLKVKASKQNGEVRVPLTRSKDFSVVCVTPRSSGVLEDSLLDGLTEQPEPSHVWGLDTDAGDIKSVAPPTQNYEASSTTADDVASVLPSDAQKIIENYKLFIKTMDPSVDLESITCPQLAVIEPDDLMKRFQEAIKKDVVSEQKKKHAEQLAELKLDFEQRIGKLRDEKNTEIAALKLSVEGEIQARYAEKETERFNRISLPFHRLLNMCLGEGGADFTTYDELVHLIEKINESITEGTDG